MHTKVYFMPPAGTAIRKMAVVVGAGAVFTQAAIPQRSQWIYWPEQLCDIIRKVIWHLTE